MDSDRAGRFSLPAERPAPTVRYVSVEGPVVGTATGTVGHVREMAARYLPADKVEGYVGFAAQSLVEQVVIRMRPQRWLPSDMGEV